MLCETCNSELLIDKVDKDGRYFYVCMNPHCDKYRQSSNPTTSEISTSEITPTKGANQ